MELAICAIARLENRYVREWVDYHLGMGFTHIYLYDNNRENEERLSDVLTEANVLKESTLRGHSEEIKMSKVTIIPLHHRSYVQMYAYQDCYDYGDFDWLLYIDIDEFFTFSSSNLSLVNWIEQTVLNNDADAILINWMCYGDCGHVFTLQKVVRQAADGQSVHYPLWRFFTYNKITIPKLLFYWKKNTLYNNYSKIAAPKYFWIKQIIKMWIITPLMKKLK